MTHLEGGPARPILTPAERALLRLALALRPNEAPPPAITSARHRAIAATPATAATLAGMAARGWLDRATQAGAPAAVRPLYIVTRAGLDALVREAAS